MKAQTNRLTFSQQFFIATMLFGLFFGAGNLIFPIFLGSQAGRNVWPAITGLLITGVGIPLLGVAAQGISRSNGLQEMAGRVSPRYSIFFTCALYLTIGPFFAIPRCASTSFTVGIEPLLGEDVNATVLLAVFSCVFFAAVLFFSLRPGKILTWVGKLLTPLFLLVLAILVVTALLHPTDRIADVTPSAAYAAAPFFAGFLEGYNTMDALASLAFGIVVINVIRGLGVTEPGAIAKNTVLSGIFSCLFMGGIYVAVTIVGTRSHSLTVSCTNGGEAFAVIAEHYLGRAGLVVLALTVILACLKTSIGLVTSCAETFTAMFPNGPKYGFWAICFSIFSLLVTNIGLNAIIAISLPVLMFLFPLAITLILLALLGNLYGHDTVVYRWVTGFTLVAALFDFVKALPKAITETPVVSAVIGFADSYLPFFKLRPELKFCYGLTNCLDTDHPKRFKDPSMADRFMYANSVKECRSKIIALTFYFE